MRDVRALPPLTLPADAWWRDPEPVSIVSDWWRRRITAWWLARVRQSRDGRDPQYWRRATMITNSRQAKKHTRAALAALLLLSAAPAAAQTLPSRPTAAIRAFDVASVSFEIVQTPVAGPGASLSWDVPTDQAAFITHFEMQIDKTGPAGVVGKPNPVVSGTQTTFTTPLPALTAGRHTVGVRGYGVVGAVGVPGDYAFLEFDMFVKPVTPTNLRLSGPAVQP